MKKLMLRFMIVLCLILSAWPCISATVNTPMTEDLDADDYNILNVLDFQTKGPWADVRAFGADPTGTNDSSSAFTSAAASGAGTVFVPKGTYRLNSTVTFSNCNVIMEGPDLVSINFYGTGYAIIFYGTFGYRLKGFSLYSQDSGQSGIKYLITEGGMAKNIYIWNFDGTGFRVGNDSPQQGVYYNSFDNIQCLNTSTQGTTGLYIEGCQLANSNANTFRNFVVKGKWDTLYHIKGNKNTFIGGDCCYDASDDGVNDCWKIEGGGNVFDGSYCESITTTDSPDNFFTFTSTSFSNVFKNLYMLVGPANMDAAIDDQGWANEVNLTPLNYNYPPFPVEKRGVENLIPNSHFKHFSNGSTGIPTGWKQVIGGTSFTRNSVETRGAKYSLESTTYLNCYIAGDSSSATSYPISRFHGKNIVAGVWAKTTASDVALLRMYVNGTGGASFGSNTHTGDGTWQFLTVMIKVPEDATILTLQLRGTTPVVYFSEPVLAEGIHLPYPNPRPLNDGYARMMGPFIGSPFTIFSNGDTTPDVSDGNHFKTASTLATTITNFDGGTAGQEITIVFGDANTTVSDAGNIKLSGSFTSTADDTLKLLYDGTSWHEISRSVN